MRRRLALVTTLLILGVTAAYGGGGHCMPPFGYIETCGAQCGQPGQCTFTSPNDYCLVTDDGYGCHDGQDDPCCDPDPGF
jgi:hypothetical protein